MKYSLLIVMIALLAADAFTILGKIQSKIQGMMPSFKDTALEEESKKRFGDKKLCVITGTSSGLGRATLNHLVKDDEFHVICAVRDVEKMEVIADLDNIPKDRFTIMPVDLNSFKSVKQFTDSVDEYRLDRPLDRLVCNAAVYQPSLPHAKWSVDGIEQQFQINFLSHFLMISRFIPALTEAQKARVTMVGSVTGNDNTVGGGGVYPIANLRELDGLKQGMRNPVAMADGRVFNGAKAYKDSKLAIMMLSNILHEKYNRATGIAFSSIYPGCIASSPLFREKRPWFRKYFPVFMKYITGGYVGEEEAGQRLFQVIKDARCTRSGVYWSWNGGPREGRDQALNTDGAIVGAGGAGGDWDSIYENDQSDKVRNIETSADLFRYATRVTGATWEEARSSVSPCPTLRVIAAATKLIETREDLEHERLLRQNAMSERVYTSSASLSNTNAESAPDQEAKESAENQQDSTPSTQVEVLPPVYPSPHLSPNLAY